MWISWRLNSFFGRKQDFNSARGLKERIPSSPLKSRRLPFRFSVSLEVNAPSRGFLNQNTLLAHRRAASLLSYNSVTSTRSLPSSPILSIPSIGNLSASHLRHPIPGRQLHRVLNKHKQRMEWSCRARWSG